MLQFPDILGNKSSGLGQATIDFQDNNLQITPMLQHTVHHSQTYSYNASGTPSATDVVGAHFLEWAGGGGLFEEKYMI